MILQEEIIKTLRILITLGVKSPEILTQINKFVAERGYWGGVGWGVAPRKVYSITQQSETQYRSS